MRGWFTAVRWLAAPSAPPAEVQSGDPGDVGALTIRAALERILLCPDFNATPRSRQLLAYVVEETLAGRAERIKAYSIATEAFGRGVDFDAHSDPIVRLEAARLRRALERYYEGAGHRDAVVISIPKGAYVPRFEPRRAAAVGPAPGRSRRPVLVGLAAMVLVTLATVLGTGAMRMSKPSGPAVPRLLVRPFDDLTASSNSAAVSRGLTQEIIAQLAKFRDIVVVEGDAMSAAGAGERYVLTGNVNLAETKLIVHARLLNAADAAVLWAHSYEEDYQPSQVIEMERDVAREAASALGNGVIFQADAMRAVANPPDDWAAYSCTLSYYAYRSNLEAGAHPQVRRCLEEAVARFPHYATAWALLAMAYLDEIRFGYPVAPGSPPASLDRVSTAANRALELDPVNVRALQSKMLALYFGGQPEAALSIGERALALNPNDSELMGEYGSRLAETANWDRGCGMVAQSLDRNLEPSGYYRTILAICAYIRADNDAAVKLIKSVTTDNPAYHLIAAAILAEAGDMNEALTERDWLLAHAPEFAANARNWAALRNIKPSDRDRFLTSLRKAGFELRRE